MKNWYFEWRLFLEQLPNVLGGEVCAWGEHIANEDVLVKMWYALLSIKNITFVILEKNYIYTFFGNYFSI